MFNALIESTLDQMFINKNANYTFESFPYNISVSEKIYSLLCDKTSKSYKLLLSPTHDDVDRISEYMMEKCIKIFNYNNQYLAFDDTYKALIKENYKKLLNTFSKYAISNDLSKNKIEKIIFLHHKRLQKILFESNPCELKKQDKTNSTLLPIVCSEYSESLQLEILKINTDTIKLPILDIGCGFNANLVRYLRKLSLEAYGVERDYDGKLDYVIKEDWLNYHIKPNSYGTIISNMAFSNHFIRNHINNNENAIEYAKKYGEILAGLTLNGEFIYAPSLPFIESSISSNFLCEIINIVQTKFGEIHVSKITRVK